jgi:hypothetical protein
MALPSDLFGALRADIEGQRTLFTPYEYRDPVFRDTIIHEICRGLKYLRYTSEKRLAEFIRSFLGPGSVLSLYSGFGDVLLEFGSGLGVEPHAGMAEWSRLFAAMGGTDVEIVNADVFTWSSERKYDRIVCNVPIGSRRCDVGFFTSLLSLLADSGEAAIHMPSAILRHVDYGQIRTLIANTTAVSAIISMPASLFRGSSVEYSLVIFRNGVECKTYMAQPKSVEDLAAIASDYSAWQSGAGPSIGIEAALDDVSWDCAGYDSRVAVVRDIHYPCDVLPLAEIAAIDSDDPSPRDAIAVSRTGGNSAWLADQAGLLSGNSIVISPSERVNPSYLLLYLNSDAGRRALASCCKKKPKNSLGVRELARVPVALPQFARQNAIVKDALALQRSVTWLESLVTEAKRGLKADIFSLSDTQYNLKLVAEITDKALCRTLPFPLAIAYRKLAEAPDDLRRLTFLIELMEVAVRFVVLVLLADMAREQRRGGLSSAEVNQLLNPSLGDWADLFETLTQRDCLFLKESKNVNLAKYRGTIHECVRMRAEICRGNEKETAESISKFRFDEHAENVYDFIAHLGFLRNYTLVKTGALEKDGQFYRIPMRILMGDELESEVQWITSRVPFDTNRVIYLTRDHQYLVLDPYIVAEPRAEQERLNILLLDRLLDDGMSYISCESGQKQGMAKSAWLPIKRHSTEVSHA